MLFLFRQCFSFIDYKCLLALLLFLYGETSAAGIELERIVLNSNSLLSAQLNKSNCIYEIYNKFDLQGSLIQLPENVVLSFKGGCFYNGSISGNNTQIDAPILPIFCNIDLQGKWINEYYYPEWFGAAGDGKVDDTESIRQTIQVAGRNKVVFQPKTYIVNVTAGKDNDSQRILFFNCKCAEMIGNGTIIKLGNRDNCNLYKYRGFDALFSVYTIDSFYVKGITFDFNYKDNPIYHTQGVRQGIQENTQQNAFQFRRVRKVTIEDCTFIGHSGTNCIDYNDAKYDVGDKVFEVTIENCKFLQMGGKSYFRKGDKLVDAYHDSSTIALHYRGNNHETPFVVIVNNNYFEGVGENAYNVIEADASEFSFCGNTIKDYASCVYPCANVYDSRVIIKNNHFQNVSRGVVLWLRGGNEADSNRYGYDNLDIVGNDCTVNMGYWINHVRYDNIEKGASNRYGFVMTTSGNDKSVRNLVIKNNTIRYLDYEDVSPQICSKASISFENAGNDILMMKCDYLEVIGNKFYNAVNRIFHNSMFQEIDTLLFNNNYIYEPFCVKKASSSDGGGVIYLNHSKAYTPSLSSPMIHNFQAINNTVIYNGYTSNDGCAYIVNSQIKGDNAGGVLKVEGNRCTTMPQYGTVHFPFQNKIFNKYIIQEK